MKELIELKSLADKINQSFAKMNEARYTLIFSYKETGEMINKAFSMIGYQDRGKWLSKNCPQISMRTAQVCVQISENWKLIEPHIQTDEILSIRKALEYIPKTPKPLERNKSAAAASLQTKSIPSKIVHNPEVQKPLQSTKSEPIIEIPKSDYKELSPPSNCSKCPKLSEAYRKINSLEDETEDLRTKLSDIKTYLGEDWYDLEEAIGKLKK